MKETIRKLVAIINKKQKQKLLYLLAASLLMAFLDTFAVALMGPFTTVITAGEEQLSQSSLSRMINAAFGPQTLAGTIAIFSAFLILVYLVRGVTRLLYNFIQARIIVGIRTELSYRLFDFVLHEPYRYHVHHNTAETQRMVSTDVSQCFIVAGSLMQAIASGMIGVSILAVLVRLDPLLTLSMALWIGIVLWVIKAFIKSRIQQLADISMRDRTNMNKWVMQAIGNLKMLLIKKNQDYYTENYLQTAVNVSKSETYYAAFNNIPKVLIDTLCMVLLFGIVLAEALLDQNITEKLPVFVTYAIAALRLIPTVGQVASTMNDLNYYRPAIDNIYDLLHSGVVQAAERRRTEQQETDRTDLAPHTELQQGIELRHVSFRFDDEDEDLFTDVNLRIPAKKSVAFVGPTGAGKTTLADIILGLQPIREGQILADGYDVRENPVWWSKMLGYIPQSIYLLDSSVRENVAIGDALAAVDDDWIWECLDRAQMKEFVQSLPQGLDTNIGENGIRLSGGQRQRIGIARALYCRPQFLLMDEATSALDNETEKAIVESINRLSGDITMLIIAHRLTTIEDCDTIYHVAHGKVTVQRKAGS